MRPFLFHIGTLGVPAFFFMIMVGSLAGTFFASWMAKREKADPVAMLDFGIIAIIASVIGSRLFHIVVENPGYYLEKPIRVLYFWQGGFVSIGAFIATFLGWAIYLKKRHLDPWRYMDIVTTGAPLAIFFVRAGCLLAGCCYGKQTDFFLHLIFTNRESIAGYVHPGVPLHATQPYFMANALVMWAVVLLVYKYRRFRGQVLATFFMYEGATRFMIEFLRGDEDRGIWFGGLLSTGQISMTAFFLTGLFLWVRLRNRTRIEKDA